MGGWGSCDFRQLQELQRRMNKLQPTDVEKFTEGCAKELAARLLAKVIKRTPVGGVEVRNEKGKVVSHDYADGSRGGTLRRGWTAASEREAELSASFGGGNGAKSYVESLTVEKVGSVYKVEIVNPVHYAPYVEYGHRTADHKGWVSGQFFLTISEQELDAQAAGILERKLIKYLGGVFGA